MRCTTPPSTFRLAVRVTVLWMAGSVASAPRVRAQDAEGAAPPSAYDLLLREDWEGSGQGGGPVQPAAEAPAATPAVNAALGADAAEGSGVVFDANAAEDGSGADVGSNAGDAGDPVEGSALDLGSSRVSAERIRDDRPQTAARVELGALRQVPRRNAAEATMLAPGVLVTNAGGEGHAVSTFLRGFEAGEGGSLEVLVDGVPINEISNSHGHGYADTHLVMPEVLQAVTVRNGPFEPDQGDFAFAGTSEYELGVPDGASAVDLGWSMGSFGEQRGFVRVAPDAESAGTVAAAEVGRADGFGDNRASERATVTGRVDRGYDRDAGSGLGWGVTAIGYAARWDQAGVVRQDDVDAGRVGFLGTYDPEQGGESTRALLSARLRLGPESARYRQTAWLSARGFRMRENFTGGLIENRYEALTLGSRGEFQRAFFRWGGRQRLRAGFSLRWDDARTQQLNLRASNAVPASRVFDAQVRQMTLSGYVGTQLRFVDRVSVQPSVRFDAFSFGVTDLNGPDSDREGAREPDQTTQAFGYAIAPRVLTAVDLVHGITLDAAYGEASRSADAVGLSDGETAPFARSRQVEAGVSHTWAPADGDWDIRSGTSWVYANVDRELLFVPEEGRNATVGASNRHALLARVRARWRDRVDVNLTGSWTRARLADTDEVLPYIPRFLLRTDAVWQTPLTWLPAAWRASAFVSAGFTWMPGRPLPLNETGNPFTLLDAAVGVQTRWVDLSCEGRNLLDRRYRQEEFFYPSALGNRGAAASRTAESHFVAGEPLAVLFTLTAHLDALF